MSNHSSDATHAETQAYRLFSKKNFLGSSTTLALIGSSFLPLPTASATVAPACVADEIASGQFLVTATDDCELTIPAGVTTLEALLVGAGGTSIQGYAGGGGEETVTTTMSKSATTWMIQVGSATEANGSSGRNSILSSGLETFTALGGQDATGSSGGGSGSGNSGSMSESGYGGAGGGALSSADSNSYNGGAGKSAALFTETEYLKTLPGCFGGGGATSGSLQSGDFVILGQPGCGAGYFTFEELVPAPETVTLVSIGNLTPRLHLPAANRGGGGGSLDGTLDGGAYIVLPNAFAHDSYGADGVVYVYYRMPSQSVVVAPVAIPYPVQTSSINTCDATVNSTTGTSRFNITGSFITPILNIEVGSGMLDRSSWTQTDSSVAFSYSAKATAALPVTLYNGQAPLLTSLCKIEEKSLPAPMETSNPKVEVPTAPAPDKSPTPAPSPVSEQLVATTNRLKVFFGLSSSAISSTEMIKLESLAAKIVSLGGKISITVTGYAQPTPGTEKTDGALSRARAAAVAAFLKDAGIDGSIKFVGAGRAKANVASSRYVEVVAVNK